MNHYEQECQRVCKWCAEGSRAELCGPTGRTHQDAKCSSQYREPCLAPTESEFAERMAQEAKDARDNLAALVQGYPTFPKIQAERDKLVQEVERLTGEMDFKRKLISKLIKERDEESTENTRLRKALQDVRGIITQSEMQCHFPSNDGTDDCGDIDLCLFHALAETLDAALAATGEPSAERKEGGRCVLCGSPAEFSEADGAWRHSGKPFQKGFEAQQFCGKYGYPIEVRTALAATREPSETEGPVCSHPIGLTTCGYTEAAHHRADGSPMDHTFTPITKTGEPTTVK